MSSGACGAGSAAAYAEHGLIEALRHGDEDAFGRLVDHYHVSLRRVARRYVSNRAIADEVVQETWVAVMEGIRAFEGRSSLWTWIFRILINHAKTRALREGRTVPFSGIGADVVDGPEAAISPERGISPEGRLLSREASERLREAIDALPPNQRIVLTLRDVEGCSTEEVCTALGIRETNGRVLLHRARARVRAALKPYLGEE